MPAGSPLDVTKNAGNCYRAGLLGRARLHRDNAAILCDPLPTELRLCLDERLSTCNGGAT